MREDFPSTSDVVEGTIFSFRCREAGASENDKRREMDKGLGKRGGENQGQECVPSSIRIDIFARCVCQGDAPVNYGHNNAAPSTTRRRGNKCCRALERHISQAEDRVALAAPRLYITLSTISKRAGFDVLRRHIWNCD